jgi:hypothetical protein
MMPGDFGDGAIDGVKTRRESEPSSAPGLPERLRHLDEEERAQGLSLRQLFAVGVVAIVTRHLFPNRDGGEASA